MYESSLIYNNRKDWRRMTPDIITVTGETEYKTWVELWKNSYPGTGSSRQNSFKEITLLDYGLYSRVGLMKEIAIDWEGPFAFFNKCFYFYFHV